MCNNEDLPPLYGPYPATHNYKLVHHFLKAGTLVRLPEDDWCFNCSTSSIWQGPAVTLKPEGVSDAGRIRGCHECDEWMFTDLKGASRPIRHRPSNKENLND